VDDVLRISERQAELLRGWVSPYVFAVGAVRSGKTFAACLLYKAWIETQAMPGFKTLLCGKKAEAVENILVDEILRLADMEGTRDNWVYSSNPRRLRYKPKDVRCVIAGANDEGAEARIRGVTAQGVLADEVTLYPESFYRQMLARVSLGDRLKVLTCNPDRPSHYIKTDFIDKIQEGSLKGRVHTFGLDDNPVLQQTYKDELQTIYTGVMYDRFVRGLWVAAEGTIYRDFSRAIHVRETPPTGIVEWVLGVDWGYEHPMAILRIGITEDNRYWVDDEIYERGIVVDRGIHGLIASRGWLDKDPPRVAYPDSARPDLCEALRGDGWIDVQPVSKGTKSEMIAAVQRAIKDNRLTFSSRAVRSIAEHESYRYKPGTEDPVKENDHAVDAVQYVIYTREHSGGKIFGPEDYTVRARWGYGYQL
jgi:PBSX family phage terminase large subunit